MKSVCLHSNTLLGSCTDDGAAYVDAALLEELPSINSQPLELKRLSPDTEARHGFQFGASSYAPLARCLSRFQDQASDRKLSKNTQCQVFFAAPFCWNLILNLYISANLSNEKKMLKSAFERLQRHYSQLSALLLESLLNDLEALLELLELINGLQQISRVFSTIDEDGNWIFIIQTAGGRTETYKHRVQPQVAANQYNQLMRGVSEHSAYFRSRAGRQDLADATKNNQPVIAGGQHESCLN